MIFGISAISPITFASSCNAVAICTEPNNQISQDLCSDGEGGAFITWTDNRSGLGYDIYAQKVDVNGERVWEFGGIAIYVGSGSQKYSKICSDGEGGAIIAWKDQLNETTYDIYTQRINANGSLLWNASGILVFPEVTDYSLFRLCSDKSGGAIVAWEDSDIHAQRINANGTLIWDINSVIICNATGRQEPIDVFSDDDGSTFFSWQDNRNGPESDIFAQKVDINGIILWDSNGTEICTANDHQLTPRICTDGAGGAIVNWLDLRGSAVQIYAQHISSTGNIQWVSNGTLLANYSEGIPIEMCSDNEGGAIIVFRYFFDVLRNLYALRINSNGTILYGTLIHTSGNSPMSNWKICSDNAGGAFIAWSRGENPLEHDILAQRVDSNGNIDWPTTGKVICDAPGHQSSVNIISNGLGSTFISWVDSIYGENNADIYLSLLEKRKEQGTIIFSNFYLPLIILAILALVIVSRRHVSQNSKN